MVLGPVGKDPRGIGFIWSRLLVRWCPSDMSEHEPSESSASESFGSMSESSGSESEGLPPVTPRTSAAREDQLQEQNLTIANAVKDITFNHLTPASKRKLTQKEELLRAEEAAQRGNQPEWLLSATKSRSSQFRDLEERREKTKSVQLEGPRPEWVQKAKEAQISRDLRGLDRFLNQKAPALPAEPEWLSKACKRRDLTSLLEQGERAHESNKEAPLWVQSSNAQRILNSFLGQNNEGVLPDWMNKGVEMSKDEKTEMFAQLDALKRLLAEEQSLTAERETLLASCKDALLVARQKLEESTSSFRVLREHRKDGENVKGFVEQTEEVFERNKGFMNKTAEQFGLQEQVQALSEKQITKENAKRESISKSKSSKVKKSSSSSKKKKEIGASKEDQESGSAVEEENCFKPKKKRKTLTSADQPKKKSSKEKKEKGDNPATGETSDEPKEKKEKSRDKKKKKDEGTEEHKERKKKSHTKDPKKVSQ